MRMCLRRSARAIRSSGDRAPRSLRKSIVNLETRAEAQRGGLSLALRYALAVPGHPSHARGQPRALQGPHTLVSRNTNPHAFGCCRARLRRCSSLTYLPVRSVVAPCLPHAATPSVLRAFPLHDTQVLGEASPATRGVSDSSADAITGAQLLNEHWVRPCHAGKVTTDTVPSTRA